MIDFLTDNRDKVLKTLNEVNKTNHTVITLVENTSCDFVSGYLSDGNDLEFEVISLDSVSVNLLKAIWSKDNLLAQYASETEAYKQELYQSDLE